MGVAQWHAGLTINQGQLNLEKFKNIGFRTIHSATDFNRTGPDNSSAQATGIKSYRGAVSVNMDAISFKSIIEYAEENGFTTGIVSANTFLEGKTYY